MIENHSFWAAIAENRTVIVLAVGLQWALAVIVVTVLATAVICWTIETLEESARRFKAWLRESKKIGRTIWA